jgi:hypothetical protein
MPSSQFGELGEPRPNEQIHVELKENMQAREMATKTPLIVTIALMDEHLVKVARAQSMIQAFLPNLQRDMKILSQNSAAHEVTLESLLYHIILSISGYHEAWATYIRDKDKGEKYNKIQICIYHIFFFLKLERNGI